MLIEIWLFEHKFQNKKFWSASNFFGYQICQQTADEVSHFVLHFQLQSNREGRNNEI